MFEMFQFEYRFHDKMTTGELLTIQRKP